MTHIPMLILICLLDLHSPLRVAEVIIRFICNRFICRYKRVSGWSSSFHLQTIHIWYFWYTWDEKLHNRYDMMGIRMWIQVWKLNPWWTLLLCTRWLREGILLQLLILKLLLLLLLRLSFFRNRDYLRETWWDVGIVYPKKLIQELSWSFKIWEIQAE